MLKSITTQTRITIDGQTYNSLNEVPAEIRKKYEQALNLLADRNNNGIPDVLEGKADAGKAVVVESIRRFVVNGRQYDRFEDLPPDVRQAMAQASGGPSGTSTAGAHLIRQTRPSNAGMEPDGITIHLSWSTVLAAVLAIAAAAGILAFLMHR
jgi:hypothetical protein